MANEELKKIIDEGTKENENNASGTEVINNLKTSLEKSETEKKEIADQLADSQFQNGFNEILGTYPLAKDHESEIKEKVAKGYTVEDAAIAILGKQNKLKTADQITAEENKGTDLGGNTVRTPDLSKKSDSAEKTAEELAEELKEFERKGEFRLS